MSELPDGIQGECLDCGGPHGKPDPVQLCQTHIEIWERGEVDLCVEMFDLLIGEPRTTKRRMNFNEFDFRWNCERELYEKLKPVFDEMIAEREAEQPS